MCRKRVPTSRFGVGTLFEEKRFACRLETPEEGGHGGRKERQEGEKRQEDRGRAPRKDARSVFQGAYAHCLRRTSAHEARKSRSPGIPFKQPRPCARGVDRNCLPGAADRPVTREEQSATAPQGKPPVPRAQKSVSASLPRALVKKRSRMPEQWTPPCQART